MTRLFGISGASAAFDSLGVTSSAVDDNGVEHWPCEDPDACICGWTVAVGDAPTWKAHAIWSLAHGVSVEVAEG